MRRVLVHSRIGNLFLAILGAIYAVSAAVLLVWFIADTWRSSAPVDRLLQLALLACAMCGVWFLSSALQNLGVVSRRTHRAVARRRATTV